MSEARVLVRTEANDQIAVEVSSDFAGELTTTFAVDPAQAASLQALVHDWEYGGHTAVNLGSSGVDAQAGRMQQIGDILFQYLNANPLFVPTLQQALSIPAAALKLQLRLRGGDLVDLPWELLHECVPHAGPIEEQLGFLAASGRIAVSRYHEAPIPLAQPEKLDRLRVLVVAATPEDRPKLKGVVRKEIAALKLMGETTDRLKLEVLEHTTAASLRRYLRESANLPHVLHFIGYGCYEPPAANPTQQPGAGLQPPRIGLLLENDDHTSHFVDAREFASLLRKSSAGAHPGDYAPWLQATIAYPRLVTIAACHSARTPASVANALVNAGVPAVIGMRLPVSPAFVLLFYQSLYTQLLDGIPVDEAVAASRASLKVKWERAVDWGIPVLFLRARMGKLFEFNARSQEFPQWLRQLEEFSKLAGQEAAAAMRALALLGVSTAAMATAVALAYPIAAVRAKAADWLRRLPVSAATNTQIVRLIGPALPREPVPEVRAEFIRLLARPPLALEARPYLAGARQNDDDPRVRSVAGQIEDAIVHDQLAPFTYLGGQLRSFAESLSGLQATLTGQLSPTHAYVSYLAQVETALAQVRKLRDAVIALAIGGEPSSARSRLQVEARAASEAVYAADGAARQMQSLAQGLGASLKAVADSLARELELLYELQRITGELAGLAFEDDLGEIEIIPTHPDQYSSSGIP